MWFKNARFYTVDFSELNEILKDDALAEDAVQGAAFHPCNAQEISTIGFSPLFGEHTPFHFSSSGNHFFKLTEETKLLPSSVIKTQFDQLMAQKETELKRQLRKNEKEALKTALVNQLLSKAFATRRELLVWCNTQAGLVAVAASSAKRAEKALAMLREAFVSFPAKLLQPKVIVEDTMTSWLTDGSLPKRFELGFDTTLKSPDESGGVIKASREDLTSEEIAVHLHAGKVATELQLTFDDSLILVLCSDLSVKRLKPTDQYLERNLPEKQDDAVADMQSHLILQGELLTELGSYLLEIFDCGA